MFGIIMAIVLAVIAIAGTSYYVDQDFLVSGVDQVLTFTTDTQCNKAGDCVDFFITDTPANLNHETVPVDYNIQNVTDAQYYEDGTPIPTESYITGNINDVSYSKSGIQQSSYLENENVMMVQIGNIISIDGQIKILHPITKEIVEPRTALYTLTMTCSELSEFCNETGITRRGTTNTAGIFNERITTNTQYIPALYDIEVFAISETVDEFGIPYEVKNTLYVEVYR
jgi:hypothetical protein